MLWPPVQEPVLPEVAGPSEGLAGRPTLLESGRSLQVRAHRSIRYAEGARGNTGRACPAGPCRTSGGTESLAPLSARRTLVGAAHHGGGSARRLHRLRDLDRLLRRRRQSVGAVPLAVLLAAAVGVWADFARPVGPLVATAVSRHLLLLSQGLLSLVLLGPAGVHAVRAAASRVSR